MESEPRSADGWRLEQSYAALPEVLHERSALQPVTAPKLVYLNEDLARLLGLDPVALASGSGPALLAGNTLPPGGAGLAQAYAGHQFGNFTGLGDGRALLLGEQRAPDGSVWDIQWKGSGRTRFSRGGDGRATLGPMLREVLIGEAMHGLGIPSTRGLAVATTGEDVYRQEGPLAGAVLTRVAASHIRVGTFQWVAAQQDTAVLSTLVDYTLRRHFPDCMESDNRAQALFAAVVASQASLLARWMQVGFIHGVMNTDNMALSGETIDYGPCAFLDRYDPKTVFSSIDHGGRYAYGNQPTIAQWNLARLAECLLPLMDEEEQAAITAATAMLDTFPGKYEACRVQGMRRKLGLAKADPEDTALVDALLSWMERGEADFTNTFLALTTERALVEPVFADDDFRAWHRRWKDRLAAENQTQEEILARMRAANPVAIPRNHLVEEALEAAVGADDFEPFRELLELLQHPYDHGKQIPPRFHEPAPAEAPAYQTFCGT